MTEPIGYRITIDLIDIAGYPDLHKAMEEELDLMHTARTGDFYCTGSQITPLYATSEPPGANDD